MVRSASAIDWAGLGRAAVAVAAPAGPGVAASTGRARPGGAARARIHRPAPLGGAHALLRPMMPCRPEGQHQHHDQEGEDHAVGRRIGQAELLGQADQQRADGGARNAAHAAHDHHHERGHQVARVLARRDRQRRAADDAGQAREAGADREGDGEHALHVDAGGRQHLAVVDTGADHHADLGPVEEQPQHQADHDGDAQHHEAVGRILADHDHRHASGRSRRGGSKE